MHDEACSSFQDIIDNLQLGLQFLKKELDVVPTIGWQIDTFGHSTTNVLLFLQF